MDKDKVRIILQEALQEVHEKDSYLLENNANERSLTHRLAVYLESKFPGWHVDCEYNRQKNDNGTTSSKTTLYLKKAKNIKIKKGKNIKTKEGLSSLSGKGSRVFPDIIVHKRGFMGMENNLLVIEAKKSSNGNSHQDEKKLKSYKEKFKYEFAVMLKFNENIPSTFEFIWT